MTLILEAISPEEGIGIVRVGEALRLIRPPYAWRDSPELPEESLQGAILRHGFSASDKQFADWDGAIAFLNEQAVAARQSLGIEIPKEIRGRDILEGAPPDILTGFLDRVENQLIPHRLFEHAESLLLALLTSSVLTRHPDLGARAARLLQLNKSTRDRIQARDAEFASRDVRFASLENRGEANRATRLAEMIRARGSVFAPAS
jgi:hypothetical protein